MVDGMLRKRRGPSGALASPRLHQMVDVAALGGREEPAHLVLKVGQTPGEVTQAILHAAPCIARPILALLEGTLAGGELLEPAQRQIGAVEILHILNLLALHRQAGEVGKGLPDGIEQVQLEVTQAVTDVLAHA
jgi:hypothetical protein